MKEYLPNISIIILNYNGKEHLKDCLASLRQQTYHKNKYEVIVVDNASTDESVGYVKDSFPWVRILKLDKNYGFTIGNNKGAELATGEYLIFLNNDTYVDKDWLKNFIVGYFSEENVVSAGCKMLKPWKIGDNYIVDYAGGKFTYDLNLYEGINEADHLKFSTQKITGYGCGAAVLVDKKFFFNVGGFDEYYFGGGEEVELGLRAWQYGHKVMYIPSAIVYHKRGVTFAKSNYFATSIWTKSIFYYILKNYEIHNIFLYTFESIFFVHIAKMLFFLKKGDLKGVQAVMRGILWFIKDISKRDIRKRIIESRIIMNRNKKRSDADLSNLGLTSTFIERLKYRMKIAQGVKKE